jgi:hypothetical protein
LPRPEPAPESLIDEAAGRYYEPGAFRRLIKRLGEEKLGDGAYVVPVHEPASARLWGRAFGRLTALRAAPGDDYDSFESTLNGRIYAGRAQDTDYLYRFRDRRFGSGGGLRVLVLNDARYEVSIANYFIFKKALAGRAAVVFAHNGRDQAVVFAHNGRDRAPANDRLVRELASGELDAKAHRFEHYRDASGRGFSVEFTGARGG